MGLGEKGGVLGVRRSARAGNWGGGAHAPPPAWHHNRFPRLGRLGRGSCLGSSPRALLSGAGTAPTASPNPHGRAFPWATLYLCHFTVIFFTASARAELGLGVLQPHLPILVRPPEALRGLSPHGAGLWPCPWVRQGCGCGHGSGRASLIRALGALGQPLGGACNPFRNYRRARGMRGRAEAN